MRYYFFLKKCVLWPNNLLGTGLSDWPILNPGLTVEPSMIRESLKWNRAMKTAIKTQSLILLCVSLVSKEPDPSLLSKGTLAWETILLLSHNMHQNCYPCYVLNYVNLVTGHLIIGVLTTAFSPPALSPFGALIARLSHHAGFSPLARRPHHRLFHHFYHSWPYLCGYQF